MHRYKILHRTYYNFPDNVSLQPHELRLRPREGHDLRIESSSLVITPDASLRWQRDMENNSIAIASFSSPARQLSIESEVIISQFDAAPLDFLVADYAVDFPFAYVPDEQIVLLPYMLMALPESSSMLAELVAKVWQAGEPIQTFVLLQSIIGHIHHSLVYTKREEPGVQTPQETLAKQSGSCRDFAFLFMEIVRYLGLAARFVSGYLNAEPSSTDFGATHAWAEVYLPGVGWKGFDPTSGQIVGPDHIALAVARLPESVPPISGSYIGPAGATLDVGVWVTALESV
jgi:transglutaminase-like putative cysteine protease